MKKVKLFGKKKDGTVIIRPDCDETNVDWIRTARLKRQLSKEEYAAKLEELDSKPTFQEEE